MSEPKLTVEELFKMRDLAAAKRRAEAEAAEAAKRAELAEMSERIRTYQLTDADRNRALARIRRAFEDGEKELMLVQFPSELCEDGGRRINNHLEGWQDTLPGVFKHVHEWWERELKPGGFTFGARVIDYPNGMPGDVGLFIGWPQMRD
jgi:hypothetical protein